MSKSGIVIFLYCSGGPIVKDAFFVSPETALTFLIALKVEANPVSVSTSLMTNFSESFLSIEKSIGSNVSKSSSGFEVALTTIPLSKVNFWLFNGLILLISDVSASTTNVKDNQQS